MGGNVSALQTIAPCGINCGVCYAFLRDKNKCPGCQAEDKKKPNHCSVCSIKNCEQLALTTSRFCFDCPTYPCKRLKQLDKRYSTKYNTRILDNQMQIKNLGLEGFVELEKVKWKCGECGNTICMHRGYCLACEKNKC